MKINLNILTKPYLIDDDFIIPKDTYLNSGVIDLPQVHAKGKIFYNLSDEVEIYLEVKGVMVLEDSVTLEKINYPFDFVIEEILEDNKDISPEYYEKNKNTLDIIEFLWENIVLEVPISLTNHPDQKRCGNGWSLNGDEDEDI